jgi:hypothetical protein
LIALNRDAQPAQGTNSRTTTNGGNGTVEGLLQLFSHDQPEYVRGLAFSDDPDPADPSTRTAGGRWIIYVLDSDDRAESFQGEFASGVGEFVRVRRDNVVVLARSRFKSRVERALDRAD